MNGRKEWADKSVKGILKEASNFFAKDLLDLSKKLMDEMQETIPDHANHAKRVAILVHDFVKILISRGWKFTDYQLYFLSMAALGHDFGKLMLPRELLDGHEPKKEEFEEIKKHSRFVFDIFKNHDIDLALTMGSVHNNTSHYGIGFSDFPIDYGVEKRNKIFSNVMFISACDFVDANKARSTQLLCRKELNGARLIKQLEIIFPKMEIETIIEIHLGLFS